MSLTQKGLFLPSYIFKGGLSCNYIDFNEGFPHSYFSSRPGESDVINCEPAITVSTCLLPDFLAYRPTNSVKTIDLRIPTHKTVEIKKLPSQWKRKR